MRQTTERALWQEQRHEARHDGGLRTPEQQLHAPVPQAKRYARGDRLGIYYDQAQNVWVLDRILD